MSFLGLDFYFEVWLNQRFRFLSLGQGSIRYRLLRYLLSFLDSRARNLEKLRNESDIQSCPESRLWVWGERLGIPRPKDMTTQEYKLLLTKAKKVRNGTIFEKRLVLSWHLQKNIAKIKWEKMPTTATMGGKINSTLASRQRCFMSSRIFVEELNEPKAAEYIENYYIGGAYIEVLKENRNG